MKIIVVGGYGVFGGRLIDLLCDEAALTLVVAGRSQAKAAAFCAARPAAAASLLPVPFDRAADVRAQLAQWAPTICVDASGPFQDYGEGRYRVVDACVSLGIHYLDLADGSEFVAGISAFDAPAKVAGVFVLSGVSSFPVLTAAVTRRLATGVSVVTAVRGGIAPSPYAGVGENVIRAISAYAGQPITIRRLGTQVVAHPFTETMRYTIAPPGLVPLRRTLFSLVDVPDLRVLEILWPDVRDVWMGAGPIPEVLHRILIALAWLVRWRVIPSLAPLARLMHGVMNRLHWGEHRGGMFVELDGVLPSGDPVTRSWHLLAEGDDGPLIPSMAIEAIVRKGLAGVWPQVGARPAIHELELDDYEKLFARRTIFVGERVDHPIRSVSLYQRLLGSAWHGLPDEIRSMHVGRTETAAGRSSVDRGTGLLSRLAAKLFRFPAAGDDLPVRVDFKVSGEQETWTRTFGAASFSSTLREGEGSDERLLCERFGPFDFAQALVVDGQQLRLVLRLWSVLGISMPSWLGPRSRSHVQADQGRYTFFVEISHPWTGLIVRYQGWLI